MAAPKKKADPQDLPAPLRFNEEYPPLEPEEREKWLTPWYSQPELTKEQALHLLRDSNAMREYVFSRSRLPFQEVLARMLRAEPSPERMRQFAVENPDKWARMVRDSATLAGYKEGIEIDANMNMRIADMSDAEIMQHLSKYMADTGLAIPGVCETVEDSGETAAETAPEEVLHALDSPDYSPRIIDTDERAENPSENPEKTLLDALLEENPGIADEKTDDSWLT